MEFLSVYSLKGQRRPSTRGVWINGKKVASIGIGIKKWVTYHGISINVDMDLEPFGHIDVCGDRDIKVTSVAKELSKRIDMADSKRKACDIFRRMFIGYYANEIQCRGGICADKDTAFG